MTWAWRKFHRDRELLLHQISTFRMSETRCFDPSDRAFVTAIVLELYGSELAFEEFARSELRKLFEHQLGRSFSIPYGATMRLTAPWFVLTSLTVPLMIDGAVSYRL